MYRYRLYLRRYRHQLGAIIFVALVLLIAAAIIYWLSIQGRVKVVDFQTCISAGFDATNSDPQTCNDGHHTYLAATSAPTDSGAPAQNLQTYSILVQGDTKGDYPQRQQVITTAAAWASLWSQIYAKLTPRPPLLPVDFTQNEVIILTAGVEPTGGYAYEISGVSVGSTGATLNYDQISPSPGCTVSPGASDPMIAIVTAKTPGQMAYKVTQKTRKC